MPDNLSFSPNTPTTEQVISAFPVTDEDLALYPPFIWGGVITKDGFKRWLAAHDWEVWRKGYTTADTGGDPSDCPYPEE